MKRNHWIVVLLVIVSLFSLSKVTAAVKQDSKSLLISQSSTAKPKLKFGYIADAPPISVKKTDRFGQVDVSGYCGSLKSYLEKDFDIEPVEVPNDKRFIGYGGISVECGPNSITKDRKEKIEQYQGKFTTPFLTTYTKLLINKNEMDNLQKNLPSNRIGIIKETTTQIIENIYTQADFVDISNRSDAIKQLENSTIDAYATDEILLTSIQKSLPRWQYSIFPKDGVGFGFESYGIVVYQNDILLTQIDNWITKNKLNLR